jgi:hypothetical protein
MVENSSMQRIEIPTSKIKMVLTLCGSILFVVLGYYAAFEDTFYQNNLRRNSPGIGRPVGFVAIIFSGIIAIFSIYKLFSKKTGLIIDDAGFTDNSGGVALGFISWSDVTGFRVVKIQSTKFVLVYLRQPNKYLSKYSKLKQKLMGLNNKMYGTPFSITSTSLRCDFDELHSLLEKYLKNYRNNKV